MSAAVMHIGGVMRRMFPLSPPLPISAPSSLTRSKTCAAASFAGSFVARSFTSSTPTIRPEPRTSPMTGYFAFSFSNPWSSCAPRSRHACCRCSRSITSSTALPIAHETGLPPKVLKWMRCASVAAIAGVVTTAASGAPLPMLLAIVTMSGTTPCVSKPQ